MLPFLGCWAAAYISLSNSLAGDLAPYVLAAFILFTTLCAYIVLKSYDKPDTYIVNFSHMLASYGMCIGLVGWVPVMAYVKGYTELRGAHPPNVYMIMAFLTGMLVFLSGLALIYQYIMYGVTWLMEKAKLFKD